MKELSLRDALAGAKFTVKAPDGRTLEVSAPAGAVVAPGSFMVVEGEGMPFPGRPAIKGNLYIQFQVHGVWDGAGGGVQRPRKRMAGAVAGPAAGAASRGAS
jgi:hypothetical protein